MPGDMARQWQRGTSCVLGGLREPGPRPRIHFLPLETGSGPCSLPTAGRDVPSQCQGHGGHEGVLEARSPRRCRCRGHGAGLGGGPRATSAEGPMARSPVPLARPGLGPQGTPGPRDVGPRPGVPPPLAMPHAVPPVPTGAAGLRLIANHLRAPRGSAKFTGTNVARNEFHRRAGRLHDG